MALSSPFAQLHPGLGLIRQVALLSEGKAAPESEELDLLFEQVDAGFLLDTPPADIWPELAQGLMGRAPGQMLNLLRETGALSQILPEVEALNGVPQIADDPAGVDIGLLVRSALDEAAQLGAPLAVRFALLVKDVGKSDSPREHLPAHYRHTERGAPRVKTIAERFGAPEECGALALQAVSEVERLHRVSRMRAGPVSMLLERNGAFDRPEIFDALMLVCTCDYRAYPGHGGAAHPKAALIEAARRACASLGRSDVASAGELEALREARALAIARAFRRDPSL